MTQHIFLLEFETWKADTEELEGCSFVKVTGVLLKESGNLRKYNKGSLSRELTSLTCNQ